MTMPPPEPTSWLLAAGTVLLAAFASVAGATAQTPPASPAASPAVVAPEVGPPVPGTSPAAGPNFTPPPRVSTGGAAVPAPAPLPPSVVSPAPAGNEPAPAPFVPDSGATPAEQPSTQEASQYASQVAAPPPEPTVQVQFPNNTVSEVLTLYELLTGKRLIRDANLAGPNLTIMVPGEIPRSEAVRLIEASLLLNGYSFVPVDDKTSKILGPGKVARSEGVPLFASPYLLPASDAVVSYFMKLNYLSPQDAVQVFTSTVQPHPYATFVPVPNVQAVVITENVSVIRKLIALQSLIDLPPAQVISEFVTLKRADAEKVVEVLQNLFENRKQGTGGTTTPGGAPPVPNPGQPGQPQIIPASLGGANAQFESSLVIGETQLVADPRTNRILVVTRPVNFSYIRKLIEQLDSPVPLDSILERPLQFVKANDVLPVLQDILSDGEESTGTQGAPGGAEANRNQNNNRETRQRDNNTGFGQGGLGGAGGLNSSMPSTGSLSDREEMPPQSVTVGKTRIIADNSTNSILVIGPPDSRQKVSQLLDMLDTRPKQVYLAAVIGELRLDDDLEFGLSYFLRFRGTSGDGRTSGIASSLINSLGGTNIPLPRRLDSPLSFPNLQGLTVYGTIADSVDIYARALEKTGKFKILSRPVVYTTNNKVAIISSGQQVPYTSGTQSSIVSGNVNSTTAGITATIQYIPAVLELQVRPLINANRDITLEIIQSNNNVVGFESFGGDNRAPIISSQTLETTVTVPDGHTVVIGGLIVESAEGDDSGVPFLMRIPVVGYLFKQTQRKTSRRELIVLLQPRVVENAREGMLASWEERYRSKLGDDAYAAAAPSAFAATPVVWQDDDLEADSAIRKPSDPMRPAGWTYQEYAPEPTPRPTPRRKKPSGVPVR